MSDPWVSAQRITGWSIEASVRARARSTWPTECLPVLFIYHDVLSSASFVHRDFSKRCFHYFIYSFSIDRTPAAWRSFWIDCGGSWMQGTTVDLNFIGPPHRKHCTVEQIFSLHSPKLMCWIHFLPHETTPSWCWFVKKLAAVSALCCISV